MLKFVRSLLMVNALVGCCTVLFLLILFSALVKVSGKTPMTIPKTSLGILS